MLFMEEIWDFMEHLALELRRDNIPILNELYSDYPGYFSKHDVWLNRDERDADEENDSTSEEEES